MYPLLLHPQAFPLPLSAQRARMPSRPFPPPAGAAAHRRSHSGQIRVLLVALTVSLSSLFFLVLLFLLLYLYFSLIDRSPPTLPSPPPPLLRLRRFTYGELKSAAGGFDPARSLGRGGSGSVFRAVLPDGKTVAVKRVDPLAPPAAATAAGEREFQNELHVLGGMRSSSRFVVSLVGYCVEKNRRLLVYEYLPNRSLQEALFGGGGPPPPLDWRRRFEIILHVAQGLAFLHLECNPPVIHGDIKPSNVLLAADFSAKISDFGLARFKTGADTAAPPEEDEVRSVDLSRELANGNPSSPRGEEGKPTSDWWWRQDDGGEEHSRDYVMEWIGSQIHSPRKSVEEEEEPAACEKKQKKMKDWWKEEHFGEEDQKKKRTKKRIRKKRKKSSSAESDTLSGELLSRELSTTSIRGTICYVAPEYGGSGQLTEKGDVYSLGVLILVIVSGRRPLHVLSSPMKLEQANLVSWCRQLAQARSVLELVDQGLTESTGYDPVQAALCINLALLCLQRSPELRPDSGEIVRILKGEEEVPAMPVDFSPSPSGALLRSQRRKAASEGEAAAVDSAGDVVRSGSCKWTR